ncbi:COPI associated [Aureobasidium sp. EXF-8845]|nr:COPI associated [Aureobasidium sp. EXF-8845]KAI4792289.1 COPI associated [Aureobasidium sp. EXF-8846]
MDFSDIFRIVNLATGALMVLGGVSQFWPEVTVRGTICALYIILFGLGNALLEFQIPPQVARYASFMFSFIGRGVFYIFIGGLCFSGHWTKYIIGGIIILVGICYVALEYVPSIEPPANMRDADAGWGAEQV